MPPLIQATGLHKQFGSLQAVKKIDFSVGNGEFFGFLGPNGAGKSTTMNMVQGYVTISSGELSIFGLNPRTDAREIKARMGVVPQENNLDPDLTVLENLQVYARYFSIPKDKAKKRALELLEFMALIDKKDEYIKTLSGGMKRRLMISRALINDPELIMLDEPTTGLDPQAKHIIWQKLRGLKREGKTMMLTTHYMEEAAQLCDRLVIMDNGLILAEGSPTELINKYIKGSVIEFRVGEEGPHDILAAMHGLSFEYELSGDMMYIHTEDRDGALKRIAGLSDGDFVNRRATLEDVFLKLTGRELRE